MKDIQKDIILAIEIFLHFEQIDHLLPHSRQEYWSGLRFPTPGDLPNPETEPMSLVSPVLAGRFFTMSHLESLYTDSESVANGGADRTAAWSEHD